MYKFLSNFVTVWSATAVVICAVELVVQTPMQVSTVMFLLANMVLLTLNLNMDGKQ